jgi:hypothetical protein
VEPGVDRTGSPVVRDTVVPMRRIARISAFLLGAWLTACGGKGLSKDQCDKLADKMVQLSTLKPDLFDSFERFEQERERFRSDLEEGCAGMTQAFFDCVMKATNEDEVLACPDTRGGVSGSSVHAPIAQRSPPPPPPAPSPLEVLLSKATISEAIEQVKDQMSDTNDETSPGAVMLALWAANHLQWTDVAVPKNETSFALVRKDPDANRGKRMCVSGTIIQIEKEKAGSPDGDVAHLVSTLWTGLLLSGNKNIVSFIAAGSTGELVEDSNARFCGVVIGTYDYANSGGGEGHAVSLVGMFDLPENRKAKR